MTARRGSSKWDLYISQIYEKVNVKFFVIFNRLAKRSRNFLRVGEREENCKTCAMRTLPFIFVDVDLSAKLYARDLLEGGAKVSMLLRFNAMGTFAGI